MHEAGRDRRLARDLTVIAVVCVLALAVVGAGGVVAFRTLYSPEAFVQHYLSLLSSGRAVDALAVPGVAADRSVLAAEGLPKNASEALLRTAALGTLDDVRITGARTDGAVTAVTATYRAGGHAGTTTFAVEREEDAGPLPVWRFAHSPLAAIDLAVHGSPTFEVNGFTLDKRQVTLAGSEADPAAPMPLLVFSPGLYSVRVDGKSAHAAGVAVLSDVPAKSVHVSMQAQPTASFVAAVQRKVDDFLDQCATQHVLQPTGCPFGLQVDNRITAPPDWSMVTLPVVRLVPDGEGWAIPATAGTAHVKVGIRSVFDGSVSQVDEDVPFTLAADIDIAADGTASIHIGAGGLD